MFHSGSGCFTRGVKPIERPTLKARKHSSYFESSVWSDLIVWNNYSVEFSTAAVAFLCADLYSSFLSGTWSNNMEMSLKASRPGECAIRCQWHFWQIFLELGQCCSSLKLPVAQNSVRLLQGTRWWDATPTWNLIKISHRQARRHRTYLRS